MLHGDSSAKQLHVWLAKFRNPKQQVLPSTYTLYMTCQGSTAVSGCCCLQVAVWLAAGAAGAARADGGKQASSRRVPDVM
jgi:hypothetical protein